MFVGASTNGQSLLEQKVSIACENLLLEDALYLLIDNSDVPISFSNKILPTNKFITYSATEVPLKEVLDHFFNSTNIIYQEVGNQIILTISELKGPNKYTISGYVIDKESGENIIGAAVYDPVQKIGTYTNRFGFFSLTFQEGETQLTVSNLGYQPVNQNFLHNKNQRVNISLEPFWLKPILVKFFNDSTFIENTSNELNLNMRQIGRMPSLGGETDLVRAVATMPGIQTGADGFGGLAVRGGGIDQNLFLLDGVPIYNAMHGIGLFSVYNSSAVKSAKILKGSFPARYGGRMSSVWDIQTKEGNKNSLLTEVDIGITSAKLTMEGPLVKNKGAFFFSGRRALFDFYSEPISRKIRGNGGFVSYRFEDLNIKFNYDLSQSDRLFLSYYSGNDDFDDLRVLQYSLDDTTTALIDSEKVNWGNKIAALRWNHIYSNKLFGNTTITHSTYRFSSQDLVELLESTPTDTINRDIILRLYASEIKDYTIRTDFDYGTFGYHKIKFGGLFTRHEFSTKISTFEDVEKIDFIKRDTIGDASNLPLYANEIEGYIEDEIVVREKFMANIGLRVSSSEVNGKWQTLLQPRILFSFNLNKSSAIDFSINRVTQFLHLLSPSRLGLPKDLWVTATDKIPPQDSWQFTTGIKKKTPNGISFNLDLYYKKMSNQLFFNGPIESINSINWQEKVFIGKGNSCGAEFLLQKQGKNWGGWLSYTIGKSNRKFPQDINNGESFPIKLDRRHNLNIQLLYKMNEKWDFASGFTIASGSFYSLPAQEYTIVQFPGIPDFLQSAKIPEGINDRKLPAYHRFDFSINHYFYCKNSKHTLKLGVTNLYNRLNPLFRTLRDKYDEEDGILSQEFVEVSLLPIFPSLRYIVELK
ncbi:MAG: carboxypeptidase-like regulatory domain-containing protein [Saprospiraceae bacterium]